MLRFLVANADHDSAAGHAPSWYAATAAAAPARPRLTSDRRVDVAVLGGGFAGLTCALHLAQRGLDVALLEARSIGSGASGRNGGQLSAQPRAEIDWYERAVGLDDAKKVYALAQEANRAARDLIATHKIDCDLQDGILETFHKPRFNAGAAEDVERRRTDYGHQSLSYLTRDQARAIARTEDVHGGVIDRAAAHLHPLNYALGLARAAEDAGATLYEQSRATSLDLDAGVLRTDAATIRADWVVLALNGYHDGLEAKTAARVMPINNFILATEPLPDGGRAALTEPVAVADSRFVVSYYRLSPDGRMLFGSGESGAARFPRDLKHYVRARMLRIYPQLAEARIDYAWGGTLGITRPRAPLFLRLGPRALSIGGWSGSGVHMATLGGKIAAEAVAASAERFDFLGRLPVPPFPGGQAFRAPLLAAALFWYGLLDRV